VACIAEEDIAEWQKRAVTLQAELQKLQSQIEENQRLRCVGPGAKSFQPATAVIQPVP
jgi:hypothetical protein